MSTTTRFASESGLSRRSFLRVSATAADGLIVSLYLNSRLLAEAPPAKIYPPDAFVHIQRDGTIVIQVNRLEFGQGRRQPVSGFREIHEEREHQQEGEHVPPARDKPVAQNRNG